MSVEDEVELLPVIDRPAPEEPADRSNAWRRWAPLAVVVALLVGYVVGSARDERVDDPSNRPPTTSFIGSADSAVASATGLSDRAFPIVRLLPGSHQLRGRLALTPSPDGDSSGEPMWVIDAGRAASRADLPTSVDIWPNPILFVGDEVLFTGPSATWTMTADATSLETIGRAEDARYLVAGAGPDELWVVYDIGNVPIRLSHVTDERAATNYSLEGLVWVEKGVADGVVGRLTWPTTTTHIGYWTPEGGLRLLDSIFDRQTAFVDSAGDLLAVYEPGPQIAIIDARRDSRMVEIPVRDFPFHACLSPDGRHLAVAEGPSPDRVVIFDVAARAESHHFTVGQPIHGLTWTADDQLIAAAGGSLVAVDVPAMISHRIAELAGASHWWIASDAAGC